MVYRADAAEGKTDFIQTRFRSNKPRSGSKLGVASLRTGGLMTVFMEICFPFRG